MADRILINKLTGEPFLFDIPLPIVSQSLQGRSQGGGGGGSNGDSITPATKTVATESSNLTADYKTNGGNDSSQIQKALDAINALGGGSLYIRKGTYVLTASLKIYSNIRIYTDGPGTVILRSSSTWTTGDMITIGTNLGTNSGHDAPGTYNNIEIEGIEFDANNLPHTALALYGVQNLRIVDNYIHDSSNYGMYMAGCTNVWVERNKAKNITGRDSIQFKGVVNGWIVDNYCDTNESFNAIDSHASDGVNGREGHFIHVLNNISENCSVGIDVQEDDSVIAGNTIRYLSGTSGIELRSSPQRVKIANNIVDTNLSANVVGINLFYLDSSGASDITIDGNIVSNINATNQSDGIYVKNATAVKVVNNIVKNSGRYGIYLAADDAEIDGNTLYDDQATHTQTEGLFIDIGINGGKIRNNKFKNNITDGVLFRGTNSNHIVTGNIFDGAVNGIRFVTSNDNLNNKILWNEFVNYSSARISLNAGKIGAGSIISFVDTGGNLAIGALSETVNGLLTLDRKETTGRVLEILGHNNGTETLFISNDIAQTSASNPRLALLWQRDTSTTQRNLELRHDGSGTNLFIDANGGGIGIDLDSDGNSSSQIIGQRIDVDNTGNGGAIGLDIQQVSGINNNIGLRIAAPSGGPSSYALQLSDTSGNQIGGITFGTDVQLYRSAADTLKIDDRFIIQDSNLTGISLEIDRDGADDSNPITGIKVDVDNAGYLGGVFGIDIANLTGSGVNVGLRIAAPSGGSANYALQLSDTGGTSAGGITFGTDTNLYRSGAGILNTDGKIGIGVASATAYLHIKAGTASANTAPLKFTSGTNLTSPEAGAMEWDGTNLFITQTTGPTRKTIAYTTDIPTISSGVYTPTRSAEANMDSNVTMTEAQYMRVGNTVTVSGRFTANPTLTATTTSFEITLPVASNIGAVEDVAGVAFCGNIAGMGAEIVGVVANDTAKVQWISSDVTSQSWSYTFTYAVI